MRIHPKLNECAEENVRSVFMRPKGGIDAAEGASEHDLNGKGIYEAGPIGPAALR